MMDTPKSQDSPDEESVEVAGPSPGTRAVQAMLKQLMQRGRGEAVRDMVRAKLKEGDEL
jgi:hypothetical protein